MATLLSIIIPTIRDPKRIIDHIRTFVSESETRVEVIVVHDGVHAPSKGRDVGQLGDLNIIHTDTGTVGGVGPGGARNKGLSVATGRYVTFVDDDDKLQISTEGLLNTLSSIDQELLIAEFSHPNSTFSRSFDSPGTTVQTADYLAEIESQYKVVNHCTGLLCSREFLIKNDVEFPVTRLVEDLVFVTRLILKTERVFLTNLFRYDYQLQPQSTKNLMDFGAIYCVLRAYIELNRLSGVPPHGLKAKYLKNKIDFLMLLAKARLPAYIKFARNEQTSSLWFLYGLLRYAIRQGSLLETLRVCLTASAIFFAVRRNIKCYLESLVSKNVLLLIYCHGALSQAWQEMLNANGVKSIFVIDDNFGGEGDILSLNQLGRERNLLDISEKYGSHLIIANLNRVTVEKIRHILGKKICPSVMNLQSILSIEEIVND